MKCSNCGNEIPDVAAFCPYCGAKIQKTDQTASQSTEERQEIVQSTVRPSKKKRKKFGLLIVIAAVMVVTAVYFSKKNSGEAYEKPVTYMFEGIKNQDADTFSKALDLEFIKDVLKQEGVDESYSALISSAMQGVMEYLGEVDTQNTLKQIKYKITSQKTITGDDLKEIQEEYQNYGYKITEAKVLTVDVSFQRKTEEDNIQVVKRENHWYIDIMDL
jgi:uncharacterized protein YpuA (DUF1002 family)